MVADNTTMSKGAGGLDEKERKAIAEQNIQKEQQVQKEQQAVLENDAAKNTVTPVQEEFVPPTNNQVASSQLQPGAVQPNTPKVPQPKEKDAWFEFAKSQVPANEEERKARYQSDLDKAIPGKGANTDFFSVPPVTGQQVKDANWDGVKGTEPGDLWLIDSPADNGFGKKLTLNLVNIKGQVLTKQQMSDYLQFLYEQSGGDIQKALELDKANPENPMEGGFGVIAGVDLSDGERDKIYELYRDYNAKPIPNLGTDFVIDSDDDSGEKSDLVIEGTYGNDDEDETGKGGNTTVSDVNKTGAASNSGNTGDEGNRTFAYADSSGNVHAVSMAYKDGDSKDLREYYNSLVADSGGDYDKLLELDRERDNLIVGNTGAGVTNVKNASAGTGTGTNVTQQSSDVNATGTDYASQYKDSSAEDMGRALDVRRAIVADPKADAGSKAEAQRFIDQVQPLYEAKMKSAPVSTAQAPSVPSGKPALSKRQKKRQDEAAAEMNDKSVYNGNVDLLNRPHVSAKKMQAAGWDVEDGTYASVYSSQMGIPEYNPKTRESRVREILYTPILPDGTVKTSEEISEYLFGLGEKGNIVELDKPENGGWGVVIAADMTDNMDLGARLHELQEAYYSTPEDYSAKAKDAEKRISEMGGNQNPVALKPVSRQAMVDAGWGSEIQFPEEVYAYPIYQEVEDKNGKVHGVIFTPITMSGDVLTREAFDDYVSSLQNSEDILKDDRDDQGVILMYDANPEDVDQIYKDIDDWRMGQADPEDGKPVSFRGDHYGETRARLQADIDKKTQELADADKAVNDFRLDPSKSVYGQFLNERKEADLKAAGQSPEDEEKLKKRRRTSSIIANIGDLLQGLINSVGTLYGAKSAELSSMSGAAHDRELKEDAVREKRYKSVMDTFRKGLDQIDSDLVSWRNMIKRDLQRAQDRLAEFESSTSRAEQRYANAEKRAERDDRRKRKQEERRLQNQKELEADRQKNRLERDKKNHEYREQENRQRGEEARRTKQTPGAKAR